MEITNMKAFYNRKDLQQMNTPDAELQNQTPSAFDNIESIIKALINAEKTAFFLDYDGTLCEFVDIPSEAFPPQKTIELLKRAAEIENLDVYIISGRDAKTLQDWLFQYNSTLICEHGYRYIKPGQEKWQLVNEDVDLSWKPKVLEELSIYSADVPGSHIEEKTSALVWHYRKADPKLSQIKAGQLIEKLQKVVKNYNAVVRPGHKIVEVSSTSINKGKALKIFANSKKYDFILTSGDDTTDEEMFAIDDDRIFSIKIGPEPTNADFRVKNPTEFRRLLNRMLCALEK
jgi:trehalose 6-phosphate synthase/phosphatase